MKLKQTACLLAALSPMAHAADEPPSHTKPVPLLNRWFSLPTDAEEPSKPVTTAKPKAVSTQQETETAQPSRATTVTTVAPAAAAQTEDEAQDANEEINTTPQSVGAKAAVAATAVTPTSKPVKTVNRTKSLDDFELSDVVVIGNTPLATSGLARKKISGNVQTAEDEDITQHESLALPDFLNRKMQSVNLNDVQNNPYQPNITYRGFEASPLLGTPIGMSVYQDGVRVNEAFGDTVNWDLIPQIAIANMEIMPGSNPLFGLNTLGGALSVRTKSGISHPGFHAQAYGGSYGRQTYQAEIGGSSGGFDWYFAGNIFNDNGWRPYSPTSVNQAFGKIGYQNDKDDIDLSFNFADNNLQGVGPTPDGMLSRNWTSIYTAPDTTNNTLYFFNLKGTHSFTNELKLTGNAYNRNLTATTSNSNTNEECAVWINGTQCLDSEGESIIPASFANSRTSTNGAGVNMQLTSSYKIADFENQFIVGGGYNTGNTNFSLSEQDAFYSPSNYGIPISPALTTVRINGANKYSNIFVTDTFSATDWLHFNGSMNWIEAEIQTTDKIGTTLNGNNTYARVNPAGGFTVNPLDALGFSDLPLKDFTAYFNYNEGFRAPTAVELSCADPNAPCTLPNSFVSDPPLQAVVSHTFETGLRGNLYDRLLKWNLSFYQTRNSNDILFMNSPGSVINGYFQNVGTTQRRGIELGLGGEALEKLNWYLSYGFVDATYQTQAVLGNALGAEVVKPGDHIPTIPQNTLKFGGEYEILSGWFFGMDLQYVSSQYARGDDSNRYPQVPDYTIVNLNTKYLITKNIELFAMGRNIFDQHYRSFGQVGQNVYLNNQPTIFMGPGAPATGYGGIRVHWE